MNDQNRRSAAEVMANAARVVKAAVNIVRAAIAGGLHGAAAAAAKELLPTIIKFAVGVLIAIIVIPMFVISAMPNMFFGYETSEKDSQITMREQALSIGGAYLSLEDFEKTQQDAIITGEAAAYENQGVTIDEIRVSSKFDEEDLCWYIAINSVAHKQDLSEMKPEEVQSLLISNLRHTTRLESSGDQTVLRIIFQPLDKDKLMDDLEFDEDARTWAGALFETIYESDALGKYKDKFEAYKPSYAGDTGYTGAPKDLVSMFYGGLLLYDTALGAEPGTLFAPAAAGVVGTARCNVVNTTKNTTRGSANLTETNIDPAGGVVSYVYEFATNQANGIIRSVCLTHPMGALYSEMAEAPDASPTNIDRLAFGGALGGDQLLLQGGLHPQLRIDFYERLFSDLKALYPTLRLHALGAPEVAHIARISGLTTLETLRRLMAAGLDSLPGAGAEILDPVVRRAISPAKPSVEKWLDVMHEAHCLGLPTSATMMYGHVETPHQRVDHLLRIRDLQARCPEGKYGFIAFIPWIFRSTDTELERQGVTTRFSPLEYLRIIAVSRLVLCNIRNIQASWLTVGKATAQAALHSGANDMGSIMIEENVVSSAGAHNRFDAEGIRGAIREAGFTPRLRDQLYGMREYAPQA